MKGGLLNALVTKAKVKGPLTLKGLQSKHIAVPLLQTVQTTAQLPICQLVH